MWSISSAGFFLWFQLFSTVTTDTQVITPMVYLYMQTFGAGNTVTERNAGLGATIRRHRVPAHLLPVHLPVREDHRRWCEGLIPPRQTVREGFSAQLLWLPSRGAKFLSFSTKIAYKTRKHSAIITITECFLAGAQGLELQCWIFVPCFPHYFVLFTAFSQPFIPVFRTIFCTSYRRQGTL